MIFFALVYAYAGMLVVCLPIIAILKLTKRLDALRLCFYTTLTGSAVWTYLFTPDQNFAIAWSPLSILVIGAACSLGVSAFFCMLGGITIRSSRPSFAAATC